MTKHSRSFTATHQNFLTFTAYITNHGGDYYTYTPFHSAHTHTHTHTHSTHTHTHTLYTEFITDCRLNAIGESKHSRGFLSNSNTLPLVQ